MTFAWHDELNSIERMPKYKCRKRNRNSYNGRNKKNVRLRKRWRDKVEEGLDVMGVRKRLVVVRDRR
jgi:hypothetical protein